METDLRGRENMVSCQLTAVLLKRRLRCRGDRRGEERGEERLKESEGGERSGSLELGDGRETRLAEWADTRGPLRMMYILGSCDLPLEAARHAGICRMLDGVGGWWWRGASATQTVVERRAGGAKEEGTTRTRGRRRNRSGRVTRACP